MNYGLDVLWYDPVEDELWVSQRDYANDGLYLFRGCDPSTGLSGIARSFDETFIEVGMV